MSNPTTNPETDTESGGEIATDIREYRKRNLLGKHVITSQAPMNGM